VQRPVRIAVEIVPRLSERAEPIQSITDSYIKIPAVLLPNATYAPLSDIQRVGQVLPVKIIGHYAFLLTIR
jgi:hypothetical protein